MLLGGDKFKNNPGNNVIIKCHECGDTNLRYVGVNRTEDGYPSGYVCGNGHETFGSIDNWEIYGQTDTIQTRAVDSNCNSENCQMPNSINVQFNGLIGVQARESCTYHAHDDLKSRPTPYFSTCGPCNTDWHWEYPVLNAPWYSIHGQMNIGGPCSYSDDSSDLSQMGCNTTVETIYTDCLGVQTIAGYTFVSTWHQSSVPDDGGAAQAAGQCGSAPPNYWAYGGCDLSINGQPYTTFLGDYPAKYRETGPAFIVPATTSTGTGWSNLATTIVFSVREVACMMLKNPCLGPAGGWNGTSRRYHSIVRRNSLFDQTWYCSEEGINTTPIEVVCGDGCEPPPDPGCIQHDFCTDGNETGACSNCTGEIYSRMGDGWDYRTFWPTRVPFFERAYFNPMYVVNDQRRYQDIDMRRYANLNPNGKIPGRSDCLGADCTTDCLTPPGEPGSGDEGGLPQPCYPAYCCAEHRYPPCLAVGTFKCKDVDLKYRVDCNNPIDSMIVNIFNSGYGTGWFKGERYSVTPYRGPMGTSTPYDLDYWNIEFNPIFVPGANGYDRWRYPTSPNPSCAGASREGWIPGYGDPVLSSLDNWESMASVNYDPDAGAVGVRGTTADNLFPDKSSMIEQPHCTRRVRNPQLAPKIPFYMVNTADISNQTIILDRYYATGGGYDYLWNGRPLGGSNIAQQSQIDNMGDIGLSDELSGYFPHPFQAHSGSLTKPELIAIVHSQNGYGAQVGFRLVPMTYDAVGSVGDPNVYIDPSEDLQPPNRYDTTVGQCKFKTRKVVHGYSVAYPLRDDPIWCEKKGNPLGDGCGFTPITSNSDTDENTDVPDLTYAPYYDYPIILPGSGYALGDQIEFRAWRNLNTGAKEEVTRGSDCVEEIIATATVTELDNERVGPRKVDRIYIVTTNPITGKDEFTDITAYLYIQLDMKRISNTRYNETYGIETAMISARFRTHPVVEGSLITVTFNDNDVVDNGQPVILKPAQIVITSVDEDSGAILDWIIKEPGEAYKIVGNNGIRWYNFNANSIFVGNCPCTMDLCSDQCIGCASKAYEDIVNNPFNDSDDDDEKRTWTRKIEALTQAFSPYDATVTMDYPFGFPAFPYTGCVTNPAILDPDDNPLVLWCPGNLANSPDCGHECWWEAGYSYGAPAWLQELGDECRNNCGCVYPDDIPSSGEASERRRRVSKDCTCYIQGGSPFISGPHMVREDSFHCWPLSKTWEFPEKSGNYGYSCCFGDPVYEGYRAGMVNNLLYPPLRPQYRGIWRPSTSGMLTNFSTYKPEAYQEEDIDAVKEVFLSIEGCNPLLLDKFGRSKKFPTKQSGYHPCRILENPTDPVPPPEQRLEPRLGARYIAHDEEKGEKINWDHYCRAYGFYMYIEPECDITYYGQYIMRTAYKEGLYLGSTFVLGDCDADISPTNWDSSQAHKFTDCEPIIGDLTINLKKAEVQFDISIGAPRSQDCLMPEFLTQPVLDRDGFYVCKANSWNYPSFDSDNQPYHDYVFGEPNRYVRIIQVALPENNEDTQEGEEPVKTDAVNIMPIFDIVDIDWQDYNPDDIYNPGTFDLPDPRNSSRLGTYVPPTYAKAHVPLPPVVSGVDYRKNAPYPWENLTKINNMSSIPEASNLVENIDKNYFLYSMYDNHSAEVILDRVVAETEGNIDRCLVFDKWFNLPPNINYNGVSDYGTRMNATYTKLIRERYEWDESAGSGSGSREYLAFRAFADPLSENIFHPVDFANVIDDYEAIWVDRVVGQFPETEDGVKTVDLISILFNDKHRSLLSNMIFQGSVTNKLRTCTKYEVVYLNVELSWDTEAEVWLEVGLLENGGSQRLFMDDRAEFRNNRGGHVNNIKVINSGNNYAFEVEERVPPSGNLLGIPGYNIAYTTKPEEINRRRESYGISGIEITGLGEGHVEGEIYTLLFDDEDYAREKIYYDLPIEVMVTKVENIPNTATGGILEGVITDISILPKYKNGKEYLGGLFYKYVKTNEHRAFPIAIQVSNYWDHPNKTQNFGRHAKFRPVVGVDPRDPDSYGKIKRIDIEYTGQEYVKPGRYWYIETKAGDYDEFGNNLNGLDIQHLVDPNKYQIYGDGMASWHIEEYNAWLNDPNMRIYTDYTWGLRYPERQSYYKPSEDPNIMPDVGDRFTQSIKWYYRTNHYIPPYKWEDMVWAWDSVLVSGDCPVHFDKTNPYGTLGGLLNRTYPMALVEEASTFAGNRPTIGNCPKPLCDQIIDYDDPSCASTGTNIMPNNEYAQNCGTPCPIHTIYDAHRYPIGHTSVNTKSAYTFPSPYLVGCHEPIALDTTAKRMLWCYEFTYGVDGYGGTLNPAGFMRYPNYSNPLDRCSNSVYSLYAEFGKWYNETDNNQAAYRAKAITYKMQDPITMKISYNSLWDRENKHMSMGEWPNGLAPPAYVANCRSDIDQKLTCEECE